MADRGRSTVIINKQYRTIVYRLRKFRRKEGAMFDFAPEAFFAPEILFQNVIFFMFA